jgi:D-tyrosyl-tRNA(Tyr) deacylase
MKAVIQRVTEARVDVGEKSVGAIGRGILVLLGVEKGDKPGRMSENGGE